MRHYDKLRLSVEVMCISMKNVGCCRELYVYQEFQVISMMDRQQVITVFLLRCKTLMKVEL